MNDNHTPVTGEYFKEIGAWPKDSSHLDRTYFIGFALCLIFTLSAYALVVSHSLPQNALIAAIAVFAVLQFIIQMLCFLHISKEPESRARLIVLCFAILIVGILVIGSLWIMFTLNGRMMPSQAQMEQYMSDQDGGI